MWGLSNLLCIMMIGAVMTNLCPAASVIIEQTDRFTPPLFLLFFVISGAELDLSVLPTVGLVGACYVVVRVLGKWLGSFLGSRLVNAHPNVQKYLGLHADSPGGCSHRHGGSWRLRAFPPTAVASRPWCSRAR